MEALDYWRLADELSIVQASFLIIGEDPAVNQDYVDHWDSEKRPSGYDAAIAALRNAVIAGRLEARLAYIKDRQYNSFGDSYTDTDTDVLDLHKTTVALDDLKDWLTSRGFKTGFFFPTSTDQPDYLDPGHPRYAPKLAAAVGVWLAHDDESLIVGKSPKQVLMKWLRENASDFNLSDEDGKPNETGIEECAKVANWRQEGGAPRTPSVTNPPPN